MAPRRIASRGIDAVLVLVMVVIGLDTVFRLLGANPANGVVAVVTRLSGPLLAPFQGVFGVENFLFTALVAVLGYCLVAAVAHAASQVLPATARAQVDEGRVPVRRARVEDGA